MNSRAYIIDNMLSCSICTAAGQSRDARREVRRDPIAHIHKNMTALPWEPTLAHDYELMWLASTEFKFEIAYGFIIYTNTQLGVCEICPVGLSLYNSREFRAATGREPVVNANYTMRLYRTSDLISRSACRYYSRVNPQMRIPLLQRTGAWVNHDGERVFTDLDGHIPPMRHTVGQRSRMVVFTDSVYIVSQPRVRTRARTRAGACTLVRWDHYRDVIMRIRVRGGCTFSGSLCITSDDGTSADKYI